MGGVKEKKILQLLKTVRKTLFKEDYCIGDFVVGEKD